LALTSGVHYSAAEGVTQSVERRVANIPRCLIGMEACSAPSIGRRLAEIGHDVRLIPAQYVKPFLKGHKNDYRDAERSRRQCSGPPCTS